MKINVLGNDKAQEIMSFYKQKALNKSELKRNNLAKELTEVWEQEHIFFYLPTVPERNDYWYLSQVFFLDRHINNNGFPYKFDLSKKSEIFIDNYIEKDYLDIKYTKELQNYSLLNLLIKMSGYQGYYLNRKTLDGLIFDFGKSVVQSVGLCPKEFRLSLIPLDIFLRVSKKLNFGNKIFNTFFDGYRLRTDGIKTSLFGGNIDFGGSRFIDSIWTDVVNKSIIPRLVIIDKSYGF